MNEVLTRASDGLLTFWCPGCQEWHGVWTESPNSMTGARWQWNGSMDKPTFNPSILVRGTRNITDEEHAKIMAGFKVTIRDFVCHSFVRDGEIQFLNDCTHALAGKTVRLQVAPM